MMKKHINSKHTVLDPSQNSNVARQQLEVVFMAYTQIHMHMLMHDCEYSFPAVSCVFGSSFRHKLFICDAELMDAAEIILQALCSVIHLSPLLQRGLD